MTIMTSHGSATLREEKPHLTETSRTNTIANAVRRRAQAVVNDKTIDPQIRTIIRYALEINDPWLAELVRRVDAGEAIVDANGNIVDEIDFSQEPETNEVVASKHDYSSKQTHSAEDVVFMNEEEKIETLAAMICRASDQSAAALLVLMGTFENSKHPKALANTVKHFAFTRCGELNLYGIVDAQMAVVEGELLEVDSLTS
jgi:hypothetical protein